MTSPSLGLTPTLNALRGRAGAQVDPTQLRAVAQEFEAMMLSQMLDLMRQSMVDADEQDEGLGFGTETMTETVNVELARQLSKAGGIGLASVLQQSMMHASAPRTAQPVHPTPAGQDALPGSVVQPTTTSRIPDNAIQSHAASARGETTLTMPAIGTVSSDFGWRADPFHGTRRFHAGVDLKAAYGQEVPVAGAGTVTFSGERGAYGLLVEVNHPNGTTSRYAHLSSTAVSAGDAVGDGQVIGRVGQSGRSTGPHLHFEVLVKGQRVDPARVASRSSTDELVKNRALVVD